MKSTIFYTAEKGNDKPSDCIKAFSKKRFNPNNETMAKHVHKRKNESFKHPFGTQLSQKNVIIGKLPSSQKVLVLCDSGASKIIINGSTIANSSYLSKLPKILCEEL